MGGVDATSPFEGPPAASPERPTDTLPERLKGALEGWRVLVIWECQTTNPALLEALAREIRAV